MGEPLDWGRHDRQYAFCPHCGHRNGDMWEIFDHVEGCEEMECGECGKAFHVSRRCSFTYTTAKPAPESPTTDEVSRG